NWIVTGDLPTVSPDVVYGSHTRFTSCELEVPHYHFETDQIKIVGGNVLVARGVRLYFADVPVFWLPFIAQSLSSGRSSGILTPRFSVNDIVRTSGGYRRRVSNVGFYWAMSDYSDALIAADWFSDTFTSLTGSASYRWNRQFLQGDLNFRQYWQADGNTQRAIDTRHAWQMDERTDFRMSGRYASSNDFVRQNSFNPREVTQSIDSEGGVNRRFDWGQLSLSANRQQYLSDDRTEWTLPSANLSLSPITLLRAQPTEAAFWNNMTWSGSASARRSTVDRRFEPADTFSFSQANTVRSSGFVRSSLSIGNLSFGQSVDLTQSETLGVPEVLLLPGDDVVPPQVVSVPSRDIMESNLNWSSSVSYQQQLIGSTTLTPRLSVTGRMFRADTASLAQNFVSAPARISFGAQLKTDIYGFYPGVGSFEAIRHKLSPSFDYQYSPESTPNDLQRQVFGARVLQPQNALAITLNQTWEAKRAEPEDTAAAGGAPSQPTDSLLVPAGAPPQTAGTVGEPRRVPQAQIANLLALRTSVVRYDFVQADSTGSFLQGFETTRLTNQISSDLLRGLSISTDHEIFDDRMDEGEIVERRFDPHLASVNLSFSMGSGAAIFRWLGLAGRAEDGGPAQEPEDRGIEDPFDVQGATDESTIIPRGSIGDALGEPRQPVSRGSVGTWTTNFSYSLQRPRAPGSPTSQMLTAMLRLQPTDAWELSWRTAYDLEAGRFNDHSIRLTRDLHRWQANFDFLQTATGNWSFRFEVSLLDNRDLKFDYDQQNLDLARTRTAN
ncbi:MAG TPA: putative LPS assembly protein LptD, partial [Longimicrobiales bacterium]|nr:putative LPS assembly protein LptD [Longimicrobiales bacterium]